MNRPAAFMFLLLTTCLGGCAKGTPTSTATAAAAASREAATVPLARYLEAAKLVSEVPGGLHHRNNDAWLVAISETEATATAQGAVHHCLFKDNPNPVLLWSSFSYQVNFNCQGKMLFAWHLTKPQATSLVDAWKTIAGGPPAPSPQDEAAFTAAAEAFRANPATFALPEPARELKIQAESAVREKRLWDAADRFAKGLEISPAWAPGRYNLALVYGELGFPSLAIAEMTKYLTLAPDAENARAAQDKIYVWRDKIR